MAKAPAPIAASHRSTLIERERELAIIGQVLDDAIARRGRALLFEGHAGLGKSSLLRAAADAGDARGMRLFTATGSATERSYPFGVVLQLFEFGIRARTPTQRRRLFTGAAALARPLFDGSAVGLAGPSDSVFPLLHGLLWLVSTLAEPDPLLLIVDDLHWTDETSRLFLTYLAQRVGDLPVALVMAARPSDGHDDLPGALARSRVRLRPLSTEASTLVVRGWRGAHAARSLVDTCVHLTGGNPFYLRELLRALDDEGVESDAAATEAVRRLDLSSVVRSVLFRIAPLGPDAVNLVRAAAVFEGRGSARATGQVAGVDARVAGRYLDDLAALDVVAPGELVGFSHPLVQSAIYGDIPRGERANLHLRVAAQLTADGAPPERIAAHLLRAPRAGSTATVAALRDAAHIAVGRAAFTEAAAFLDRALAEPPDPGQRLDVLGDLAAAEAAGGLTSAEPRLHEAIAHAPEPRRRAELRQLLGRFLHRAGRATEAVAVFAAALAELADRGIDDELITGLRADFAAAGMFLPASREAARRELAAAPAPDALAHPTQRNLLACRALLLAQDAAPAGEVAQLVAAAWTGGALLAERGVEDRSWLFGLWALSLAERYDDAVALASAVIEEAAARGSASSFATASTYRGWALAQTGQLAESIADLQAAIARAEDGWQEYLVLAHATLAQALCRMGSLDAARRSLDRAAATLPQNSLFDRAAVHAARARFELAADRPASARDAALSAGQLLAEEMKAEWSVLSWRSLAAEAALRLGDHARARSLVARDIELAEQADAAVTLGRALRLSGLIDTDADRLHHAVEVLQATPARLELAHALVDEGSVLRRAGQRIQARAPLERGAELAERCGAAPLRALADAELAACGGRRRVTPAIGTAALTPSERRVTEFAATGRTTPEIAQALFVSRKTVEFHLHNAYHKLGISSRRQLRTALDTAEQHTLS